MKEGGRENEGERERERRRERARGETPPEQSIYPDEDGAGYSFITTGAGGEVYEVSGQNGEHV